MNNKHRSFSSQEQAQKDYYNRIAREYESHYANKHALRYRFNLYDNIFKNQNFKGAVALDAMCGGGEATSYLIKKGVSEITGLDISEECISIYKKKYPKNMAVCSSIINTKFKDNHFDIVITDSLHHLHPDVDAGVEEIFRILKPNGLFCCWEPSSGSVIDIARKLWYKFDSKYFEENEESIDIDRIIRNHASKFDLLNIQYGGNFAYIFVNLSMPLRLPRKFVDFCAPALISTENILNKLGTRFLSCWVLCLFKKRAA
jgi:ubiquinone/menaquinone biosynthesis C-methylase UbiE